MRPPEYYVFISPDGERHEGFNIRQFARQHGLDAANMQHVHLGERNHHKGWTSGFNDVFKQSSLR